MKYKNVLEIANDSDELLHLRALINARGVGMDDEVDEDFFEVLLEEGYGEVVR